MTRYLGSGFAAVVAPCFVLFPILFGALVLPPEGSAATVFIAVLCLCCSILWASFIWKKRNQLYTWGVFSDNDVNVSVLFQEKYSLPYDKCRGCGIGSYRHAFMNLQQSAFGTTRFYIFLSIEPFDEAYRYSINRWSPSDTRMKVAFSEKTYKYLLSVLPQMQAQMLEKDHLKYIEQK